MKILKHLVLAAILVLAIASLAQATTETWTFSDATHTGTPPNPNAETFTFLSSPGGVGLTATGYAGLVSTAKTSLFRKFSSGHPDESGLGLTADSDHEIGTSNYIQLDLTDLYAKGFTSLTMTIGSIQAGEGYRVLTDGTADSFGDGTQIINFTNNSGLSAFPNDQNTFTVALTGFQFLDINANFANVLIENGATASNVPVPPTVLLMGSGLLGLVGIGWRRKQQS